MSSFRQAARFMQTFILMLAAWSALGGKARADCVPAPDLCVSTTSNMRSCEETTYTFNLSGFTCYYNHPNCRNVQHCTFGSESCGRHWTGWQTAGDKLDNACPRGCRQSHRISIDSRYVDLLKLQHRELWACDGTPQPASSSDDWSGIRALQAQYAD